MRGEGGRGSKNIWTAKFPCWVRFKSKVVVPVSHKKDTANSNGDVRFKQFSGSKIANNKLFGSLLVAFPVISHFSDSVRRGGFMQLTFASFLLWGCRKRLCLDQHQAVHNKLSPVFLSLSPACLSFLFFVMSAAISLNVCLITKWCYKKLSHLPWG